MKSLLTASMLLLFCNLSTAQKNFYTIKFKASVKQFKASFNFAGVIDRRLVKEHVGYARIGINNRIVPAWLEGPFEEEMAKQVERIILSDEQAEDIYFVFHEMNVNEQLSGMSEKGICRAEIEFIKQDNGIYYSLGSFSSEIQGKGLDVTGGHDKRILQALEACIIEFEKSRKDGNPVVEVFDFEETTAPYDYTSAPVKGMYSSFAKMGKNEPMEDFDIQFSRIRINSKHKNKAEGIKYNLKILNKEDKKKRIMFISNGTDIFMHASRYSYFQYYLKSKHLGRYIYFEDRFPSQAAGMAFGLTGTIASNKLRSIILDTSNGKVILLNKNNLSGFLGEEHKEITKAFAKSKKKTEDVEAAIVALNKKIQN